MKASPLPDNWTGPRTVIGPSDPTRDDMRACEYAVAESHEYPGRPRVLVRVELDDDDRAIIAEGGVIWLEMDGGELPWALVAAEQAAGVPV